MTGPRILPLLALLGASPLPVAPPVPSDPVLTVDLGSDTGPFHGGASGTLYGLYDASLPAANLIEGIALRTVSTKAQDGPQHPGADALEVARPLADASGGDTYIYMTDIHRSFPYDWKTGDCARSVAAYLDKVRAQTEQVRALPPRYRARIVFVPFNEPEGNMFGDGPKSCDGTSWLKDPTAFFDAWDRAYRLIRGIVPDARIAGPNTSILFDQVEGFLAHAIRAGTVPDVVTWHELSNPATVRASVRRYRAWEAAAFAGTPQAGRRLPVNINEYAYNYHTSVPGQMIQWIAAIEDAKVDADIAYWNIDGNLGDSAVQAGRGNGQWWLLNAYAAMGGHTLAVTPPQPDLNYTLQGVATLDPARRQARLLFGGRAGAATIALRDIPAAFGGAVRVLVREIRWTGQLGDAPAPAAIADRTIPVAADRRLALSFGGDLPALREESAYEMIVMPAAGTAARAGIAAPWRQDYEAEGAARRGTGLSTWGPGGSPDAVERFHTSGRLAVAGFDTGRDVALDFAVTVPRDGRYDLRVLANSFSKDAAVAAEGPTGIFVRIDGGRAGERELFLPLGYKPAVWDHADLAVPLTRGRHVVTLATRSLDGRRRTQGSAMIDRITLSPSPANRDGTFYEAALARLEATTPAYRADGARVPLAAGATATFWVYAARDGLASLAVDRRGPGTVALRVNGRAVAAGGTERVFLTGGINKVVVAGDRGTVALRGVRVGEPDGSDGRSYEAEAARVEGGARVAAASRASGGRAVVGIGGAPGNRNVLRFEAVTADRAGDHALTIRFANDEQSPATHYNPDPLARVARIRVNGAPPILATFPNSFHRNNWWEMTVPVRLRAGRNTITVAGEEQPDWDGRSYASGRWPGIALRSRYAPDIDRITVTPMTAPARTGRRRYSAR